MSTSTENAVEVSRLMLPDDANLAGNVHGGQILKMVEEAGMIVAQRHFNLVSDATRGKRRAALARVEESQFNLPMFIGDVAQVHAHLTFVAEHSAEVMVEVYAETFGQPQRRLTNTATLW